MLEQVRYKQTRECMNWTLFNNSKECKQPSQLGRIKECGKAAHGKVFDVECSGSNRGIDEGWKGSYIKEP